MVSLRLLVRVRHSGRRELTANICQFAVEGRVGARHGLLLLMVGLFREMAVVFSEQWEEVCLLVVGGRG
jgi:hypothetical protein